MTKDLFIVYRTFKDINKKIVVRIIPLFCAYYCSVEIIFVVGQYFDVSFQDGLLFFLLNKKL